ncbi:MAG: 2-C-methyl-D-erythritol 2,4-cyclodiphosphate synthase, partial [Candidatus Krumholzibacteria bacterium]|nr:2-C-methyl-D-erythritol 2,4-cyclodiphosphate synthase [Candidatus Krumholzibacteria bacterium]
PLVLGGVRLDHEMGLSGHSDADALVHALCDAILGAIGEGDLGRHFPETDEFKDIDSLVLLERVAAMAAEKGYRLVNADCIVHAEQPAISPHAEAMAAAMAAAAGTDPGRISVKATRGEGLGPVGEKRAIAARAVVLLEKKD